MVNSDKVTLGGREFERVNNGLDADQVAALVNDLEKQRDELVDSSEHVSSLRALAEKTVIEADRIAMEVKQNATAEANDIIAEAKRQAEILSENERKRIQNELSEFIDKIRNQTLAQFENIIEEVATLESQPPQILSVSEEADNTNNKITDSPANDLSKIIDNEEDTSDGEPDWELDIVPPVDIAKVMDTMAKLGQLPAVGRTEIIPRMPGTPLIMVYLSKPVKLVETLNTIPNVAVVTDDPDSTVDDSARPQKIKIKLTEATAV